MKEIFIKSAVVTFISIVLIFSYLAFITENNFLYVVLIGGGSYFVLFYVIVFIYNILIKHFIVRFEGLTKLHVHLMIGFFVSLTITSIFVIGDGVYWEDSFREILRKITKSYVYYTLMPFVIVIVNYLLLRSIYNRWRSNHSIAQR